MRTERFTRGRTASSLRKVLAVVLAIQLVGFLPVTVFAQDPILCGLFGTCAPSTGTGGLLGLPNGTLIVRTFNPWDQVVKGSALTAWAPLEAEARAYLSVLHGVPNDDRLPHAAVDELRALILARLLQIAAKQAHGDALTDVEKTALDAFRDAIVARRVNAAQKALDEYYRWSTNYCGYKVPTGFGFEEYDPEPLCSANGTVFSLNAPPRPPTAQQFTAYGAALANRDSTSGDAQAALLGMVDQIALASAVATAAAVAGIAALTAATSTAVAAAFATLVGSSVLAAEILPLSIGLTLSNSFALVAGSVGFGIAASLPAIIIIATVITVVATIQIVEDSQILPTLEGALSSARQAPDIPAMSQNEAQTGILLGAFMAQTLPDYQAERLAAAPVAPTAPATGDPMFDVNGQTQAILETHPAGGQFQQTFMSGGWFVTRTRLKDTDPFGPWQWSLGLKYTPPGATNHALGIQPGGFLDVNYTNPSGASAAVKTTHFETVVLPGLTPLTVTWTGNHAPVLSPTAATDPIVTIPVALSAGAADPDGDTITIRWYVQDPDFLVLRPDLSTCDFRPSSSDPLAPTCPWRLFLDAGSGITPTFAHAGSYEVLVLAQDSKGAVSSQRFFVKVAGVAPTLTLTPPASAITEGQSVSVRGRLDYPQLPGGYYGSPISLIIDWDDSTVTRQNYPCSVFQPGETPPFCSITNASLYSGPTTGPWDFDFTHTYAFSPSGAVPSSPAIKVYATTRDNVPSPVTTFHVAVANVVPGLVPFSVCGLLDTSPLCLVSADRREVPAGTPLTIRAVLTDIATATHAVKVFWGDGGSSLLAPGCTNPECPTQVGPDPTRHQFLISHPYETPGTYPIQILVNDGGPGGKLTYNTNAVIFGALLQGPTDVAAGDPAIYTYSSPLPAGATLTAVPNCGLGTLMASVASTFTCVFPDLPAGTQTSVGVNATIAGITSTSGLSVNILPRPTTVSAISGLTTVTEGATKIYTYTESHSPLGSVVYTPGCGAGADLIDRTDGSSITCRFHDVSQLTNTVVSVTVSAGGTSVSSTLPVTIMTDTVPPVLSLPAGISANSTSNAGANVSYSALATDVISGAALVICIPGPNSLFPIGQTTVSCSANDWQSNQGTGSFSVVVIDKTVPTLTLPAPITLDASGPSGAVATFTATASDAVPVNPVVSCLPASGSTFAAGTTAVVCQATDTAGNKAVGQFNVTVRGATQQLASLSGRIQAMAIDAKLKDKLLKLLSGVTSTLPKSRSGACGQLSEFLAVARDAVGKGLTAQQLNEIAVEVNRIRAVIGC